MENEPQYSELYGFEVSYVKFIVQLLSNSKCSIASSYGIVNSHCPLDQILQPNTQLAAKQCLYDLPNDSSHTKYKILEVILQSHTAESPEQ